MPKTSNIYLVYLLKDLSASQLERLITEIKSITGMDPHEIRDGDSNPPQ